MGESTPYLTTLRGGRGAPQECFITGGYQIISSYINCLCISYVSWCLLKCKTLNRFVEGIFFLNATNELFLSKTLLRLTSLSMPLIFTDWSSWKAHLGLGTSSSAWQAGRPLAIGHLGHDWSSILRETRARLWKRAYWQRPLLLSWWNSPRPERDLVLAAFHSSW